MYTVYKLQSSRNPEFSPNWNYFCTILPKTWTRLKVSLITFNTFDDISKTY